LAQMYQNRPDGLCGNDDVGQMSAWYVFSALGFYPVAPGSDRYMIGAPTSVRATLHLENGQALTLLAPKLSEKNRYIQSITLHGQPWPHPYFRHADLVKGDEIVFHMGPKPKIWWKGQGNEPTLR
ncbi:MAG: glycoside hydrolase family 92 protein, partial [Firmicutes bacterium]|nr:glycoside hydrolase family 92 protein [Bacillota bacterium]